MNRRKPGDGTWPTLRYQAVMGSWLAPSTQFLTIPLINCPFHVKSDSKEHISKYFFKCLCEKFQDIWWTFAAKDTSHKWDSCFLSLLRAGTTFSTALPDLQATAPDNSQKYGHATQGEPPCSSIFTCSDSAGGPGTRVSGETH